MIRKTLLTLVALASLSAFAQSYDLIYRYPDGNNPDAVSDDRYYDDDYYYGDDAYYDDGDVRTRDDDRGGFFGVHCAPETVQGNVVKTDRTLLQLSQSVEFQSAEKFRTHVHKISRMKDLNRKLHAYFAMLGIDSNNNAEIAEFLGARRPKSEWLVSLEEKAGLTPRQADRVVRELTAVLRGGLR